MPKKSNVEKFEREADKRGIARKGHNRAGGIVVEQLKSVIDRVENLEEEKAGLIADIRDIYSEAKGNGFDVKTIRAIIKLRSMDPEKAEEAETIFDTYRMALGMIPAIDDVI